MRIAIVRNELKPADLLAEVASAACGGTVVFVGTVREVNEGRRVSALDYEAYGGMAEQELAVIATEAEDRWQGARIVCEHRVGTLAIGDTAVAIAAAHPHREAAFDACRYVIEELKRRVPVWKREHYDDGTAEWVEARSGSRGTGEGE